MEKDTFDSKSDFEQYFFNTDDDTSSDEVAKETETEAARIERDQTVTNWLDGMNSVQDQYGKEGVRRLLEALKEKGNKLTKADCAQVLENLPTRQALKAELFPILEKIGILSYGDHGEKIIDLDKLTALDKDVFSKKGTSLSYRKSRNNEKEKDGKYYQYSKGHINLLLYEALRDEQVISAADYTNGIRDPKPLLYTPDTTASAFSIDEIKKADFYLGVWDLPGNVYTGTEEKPQYPSQYDELDYVNTEIACKVYHSKYGAGYRDENGVLFIKNKDGEYQKASADLIQKDWTIHSGSTKGGVIARPFEFLQSDGAELVQNDILRVSDFRTQTTGKTAETYRIRKNGVSSTGMTSINNVLYYLGKRFYNQPIAVYKISEGLGGIVRCEADGSERLEYTFTLYEPGDARLTKTKMANTFYANAELVNLTPFSPDAKDSEETPLVSTGARFNRLLELGTVFSREADFNLTQLNFTEQASAVSALSEAHKQDPQKIINFVKHHRADGLKTFLSLTVDRSAGHAILQLADALSVGDMHKLITLYNEILESAEDSASAKEAEKIGLNPQQLKDILLVRAKDILTTTARTISANTDSETLIKQIVKELRHDSPEKLIKSGSFRRLAEALTERPDNSVSVNEIVNKTETAASDHALYLRALHERGELKPIPEIHWRVDRSLDEYKRRFGFSIPEFLQALSDPTHKKLLLEFGPGSGASKQERATAGILDRYEDVAMADALYYPLAGSIYNTLDWEKLTSKLGNTLPLIDKDKQLIAEMIYKAIMITDSEEEKPDFTYAQKRIQEITDNPRKLTEIITKIAPHLLRIENIPSTISTRDEQGNVIYPYKINVASAKERSLSFLAAKAELANNAETYLKKEQDPFQAIPAYPAGTIIGDFGKIKALKDNQVDVALGVRSTVYKRGEDYVEFMNTMVQKLAPGGVYIDDNVRDNDGWTYRLAELSQVQAECADPSIAFTLILGPGFPGEDYRQDEVPLAVVVSKGTDYHSQISTRLEPGYRLVSLTDYTADKQNLQTLDSTGYVLKTVAESEITRGPSVDARRSA